MDRTSIPPSADALPAPSTPAAPTVAAALGVAAPATPLPSGSGFSAGSVLAGLLLAALAVTALVMARRRRRAPRLVEILESASLGPKRSLVVARLAGEILVLGSSEGAITLLATRSAADMAMAPAAGSLASSLPDSLPSEGRGLDLFGRLLRRPRPAKPSAAFENMLTESIEDVELRRKLAAGQVGSVP